MKRRLSVLVMALGALLPVLDATATDCHFADQTRTVLTGDDIERSGAIRLTDIFRLMPEWHTVSTDFYLWQSGPGIFSLPDWDGMMMMVDGQPLHATLLGISYLNAYPLDVGLIDSIEVYEGPVLCEGIFAPSGLINIRTRLEDGNVSLGAFGAVANETRDPGPYRYTPLETENIDRSGPVYGGFGAVSGPHWHARAYGKADEHHVTGVMLRPRIRRLYGMGHPPRHFLDGGHVDVRFEQPFRLSVMADQSHFEHFRYMPTFGSEIPFSTDWTRAGASGSAFLRSGMSFFFSGEYSYYQLYENPVTPEIPIDWRNERYSAQAGLSIHTDRLRVTTGFGHYSKRMRGERRLADPDVRGTTFFLTADASITPQVHGRFAGRFARETERPFRSLIASLDYRPFKGHTGRVSFSDVQMPMHQATPFFYWVESGFAIDSLQGLAPPVDLPRKPARRTSLSAGWHWNLWSIATLSAHGTVAWFDDFPIAGYDLGFVSDLTDPIREVAYFEVDTRVYPANSGRISRISVEATVTPISSLKATLYYGGTVTHDGDDPFRRAWQIIPRHRGYASITYSPMQRASVHVRISHESPSFWPEYASVEAPSDGRYPAELPILTLLDIAVTKRFWHDHVRLSALISNALDRRNQRHPAGGNESLALLARLQIQI